MLHSQSQVREEQFLPVTEVIDFRMDFELRVKEDPMVPGSRYLRLPLNSSRDAMSDPDAKKIQEHKTFDSNRVFQFQKKTSIFASRN